MKEIIIRLQACYHILTDHTYAVFTMNKAQDKGFMSEDNTYKVFNDAVSDYAKKGYPD